MVGASGELDVVMHAGEMLQEVPRKGPLRCIESSMCALFPGMLFAGVALAAEHVPSYREVLSTLPCVTSKWTSDMADGKKYIVHLRGHCIGVELAGQHVDCWDSLSKHGVRFEGANRDKLLQICDNRATLEVYVRASDAPSDDNPPDLSDPRYGQRAGGRAAALRGFVYEKREPTTLKDWLADMCEDWFETPEAFIAKVLFTELSDLPHGQRHSHLLRAAYVFLKYNLIGPVGKCRRCEQQPVLRMRPQGGSAETVIWECPRSRRHVRESIDAVGVLLFVPQGGWPSLL